MQPVCTFDQVRISLHGDEYFRHKNPYSLAEITPRPDVDPSFDPNLGFPNGRKERGIFSIKWRPEFVEIVNKFQTMAFVSMMREIEFSQSIAWMETYASEII